MNLSVEGRLKAVVKLTFLGGVASAVVNPSAALAADTGSNVTELKGVQVTGSLIRRVDTESSNPVQVISRKAIESSGATTVGQLLEQLPMLTGDALTPQVNNGGAGDGASTISLRGLGDARTLILLDGKRVVSNDVNVLPTSMIERIEVLNEGAGTVYGSDAIGGVVNFITRKNFSGTEIAVSAGEAPDHHDATKTSFSITEGLSSSKGHMVLGMAYDKSGSVAGRNRSVSDNAYAILYGQVTAIGSSRTPQGSFTINQDGLIPGDPSNATWASLGCTASATGKIKVMRKAGTDGSTAADFTCASGTYNYQAENYVYVPNDHLQLFTLGSTNFTDNLKGYASAYFTHTTGKNQLASEAFDSSSLSDPSGNPLNLSISQYSQYNPTGQDVTFFKFRAVETGDRSTEASEDIYQATLGLKATLFDRFDWDTSINYGREDDAFKNSGYLNISQLAQQLGPSKDGVCYTDGTYTTAIKNCTPINVMGTTGVGYGSLSKPVTSVNTDDLMQFNSNISGDLFALPLLNAGPISGAAGFEWRSYRLNDTPDQASQLFQLSESNGLATAGSYNVREVYGEFLIPILRDLPFAKSLNIDAGTRWSSYSNFGETVNGKYALEYRPRKDLLIRATYADIFRAPTINDLYAGAANSAPSYADPCFHYTGQPTAQFPYLPDACKNVPTDGTFKQADSQGSVRVGGNPKLQPETGYTTDFGFVYSPDFYKPLSVSADFWNYRIHDAIETLDLQTALDACAKSGQAAYCGNNTPNSPFYRDPTTGYVVGGYDPPANIGTLFTDGFDFGIDLRYPHTRFGSFNFGLNGTYLDRFEQSVAGVSFYSQAGQVGGASDFIGGGYPRLKFTSSLDWSYGSWDVYLRNRFIAGESDNGGQDGSGNYLGVDASGLGYAGNAKTYFDNYGLTGVGQCNKGGKSYQTGGSAVIPYTCYRDTGYVDYQDVAVTYSWKQAHTDFTVGVNDIFDQGAPIVYTFGPAFSYDASNYDVTGRYVYGRIKVYFK